MSGGLYAFVRLPAAPGYLREPVGGPYGTAGGRRDFALYQVVPLTGRVIDGRGDAIETLRATLPTDLDVSVLSELPPGRAPKSPGGHV